VATLCGAGSGQGLVGIDISDTAQTAGAGPTSQQTATPSPSAPAPDSSNGSGTVNGVPTSIPLPSPGIVVGPVPVSQVVNEMVAKAASVVPVTAHKDRLIYTRFAANATGAQGNALTSVHGWWVKPDTLILTMNTFDGRDMGPGGTPSGPPNFDQPTASRASTSAGSGRGPGAESRLARRTSR
jgi:hypothetical protein